MNVSPSYFPLAGLTGYALLASGAMSKPAPGSSITQTASYTLLTNPTAVLNAFRPFRGAANGGALALFHHSVTAPALRKNFTGTMYTSHPLSRVFADALSPQSIETPQGYFEVLSLYLCNAQAEAEKLNAENGRDATLLRHLPPQLFGTRPSSETDTYAGISARSLAFLFLTHHIPPYEKEQVWESAVDFLRASEAVTHSTGVQNSALASLLSGYIMLKTEKDPGKRELLATLFLDQHHLLGAARALTKGKNHPEKAKALNQHAVALRKQAHYFSHSTATSLMRAQELYEQALQLFQTTGNIFEEANTYVLMANTLEKNGNNTRSIVALREKAARLYTYLHGQHHSGRRLNYAGIAANLRDQTEDHAAPLSQTKILAGLFLDTRTNPHVIPGALSVAINYACAQSSVEFSDHRIIAKLTSPPVREIAVLELQKLFARILDISKEDISVSEQRNGSRTVSLTEEALKTLANRHETQEGTPGFPSRPGSTTGPLQL